MTCWQHSAAPGNDYLLISQDAVWDLLRRLGQENRHLAHFPLRDACGREPSPTSRKVVRAIENARLSSKEDEFTQALVGLP